MRNIILTLAVLLFSLSVSAQQIIKLKSFGVDYEDADGKKQFSDNSDIDLNLKNNTMIIFHTNDYELYEFRNVIKSDETEKYYLFEYRAAVGSFPCTITILISKLEDFTAIIIDAGQIKIRYNCELKK